MQDCMIDRFEDCLDLFSVTVSGRTRYMYDSENTLCDICKTEQINRPAIVYWNFVNKRKPQAYLFCMDCMNRKLHKSLIIIQHAAYILPVLVRKIDDLTGLTPVFKRPPNFQSLKSDLTVFDVAKLPASPTIDMRKLLPAFDDLYSLADVKRFVQIGKNPDSVVEKDEENAIALEDMNEAADRYKLDFEKRKNAYIEEQEKKKIEREKSGLKAELCGKQVELINSIVDEKERNNRRQNFFNFCHEQSCLSLDIQIQNLQLLLEEKNGSSSDKGKH